MISFYIGKFKYNDIKIMLELFISSYDKIQEKCSNDCGTCEYHYVCKDFARSITYLSEQLTKVRNK